MREAEFRAWLEARRWNGRPLSAKAIYGRIRRLARLERSLVDLGFGSNDIDAVVGTGRYAELATVVKALFSPGAAPPPITLVPQAPDPTGQLRNIYAVLRQYGQFAGAVGSVSGWPELEELRTAFLDRVPDFERFDRTDSEYERIERVYKDAMIADVRAIAASDRSDEEAGRLIYRALIPNQGALLSWQVDDDFARKFPALEPEFDAAIGRLARDPAPTVDALMTAVETFESLHARGASSLTIGQIARIAFTVLGVVRPGEAAPFAITKAQALAKVLTGDRIFTGSALQREQAETWLALLHRIEAVMRDEWHWHPRDLVDVQGFAWVALDDNWREEDDEDAGAIWFVTARNGEEDGVDHYVSRGEWHLLGDRGNRINELVREMVPGDRIVLRDYFVQRHGLPFDARGKSVSVMRVRATGLVTEQRGDGVSVGVDWTMLPEPRLWFFYTNNDPVWRLNLEKETAQRLADFVFEGEPQDYAWFLERWGLAEEDATVPEPAAAPENAPMPTNLILYGPPGTGKTFATAAHAVRLCGEDVPADRATLMARYRALSEAGRIEFVTFHQSMAYEEFVEGLRPSSVDEDGRPLESGFRLAPTPGIFRKIARRAESAAPEPFVLICDEINRANISKVFGELITLLEGDKRIGAANELRVRLPYSGEPFGVPANLHVVGTMNTADRSIALIDKALRRRFTFVEMMPDYAAPGMDDPVAGADVTLAEVLQTINDRIEYLLDREHQIGHAWLLGCETKAALDEKMRSAVIPLIAEYFFEDWGRTADVLGGRDDNPFLDARVLAPPPGMAGEEPRVRWSVKPRFAEDAYTRLVTGR